MVSLNKNLKPLLLFETLLDNQYLVCHNYTDLNLG